jgi:sulfatase modifying factor 1
MQSDPPGSRRPCRISAVHGGSWLDNPEYLRVGEYALNLRVNRNQVTGFRVVRTLSADSLDSATAALDEQPASSPSSDSKADPAYTAPRARRSTFRDCANCPEMIVVPAGSFTMGSKPTGGWDTREVPEHRVTIEKEFAVGVYDVTRAQYMDFVQATRRPAEKGCDVVDPEARWITDHARDWRDPAFNQTESDPVVCVSWEDAHAYVRWLNTRVASRQQPANGERGGPYRLLTEAEWEYAARAGSSTPYYWGAHASHEYANYGVEQCYPCGVEKRGKDHWYFTSPAGSFAPNVFGLYDMSGNVWQWTEDCMHYGYAGSPNDGSVWAGGECKLRVLRGGSWLDPPGLITVTLRNPWAPDSRNNANGFRVARSLD